jgi:hypothetical protein
MFKPLSITPLFLVFFTFAADSACRTGLKHDRQKAKPMKQGELYGIKTLFESEEAVRSFAHSGKRTAVYGRFGQWAFYMPIATVQSGGPRESSREVSELEQKLREALKLAQDAHEISYGYPNPYAGIPSGLTKAIIYAEQWLKKALSEAIANDIDQERGGKSVSAYTTSQFHLGLGEAPTAESETDETGD